MQCLAGVVIHSLEINWIQKQSPLLSDLGTPSVCIPCIKSCWEDGTLHLFFRLRCQNSLLGFPKDFPLSSGWTIPFLCLEGRSWGNLPNVHSKDYSWEVVYIPTETLPFRSAGSPHYFECWVATHKICINIMLTDGKPGWLWPYTVQWITDTCRR